MDKRLMAAALAVLAVVLLVLNFTLDDAGTLFLLLAVACAAGAAYLFTTSRSGDRRSR
jgi:hypothetical protein